MFSQETLTFLQNGSGQPREFLDKHRAAYVAYVKNPQTLL